MKRLIPELEELGVDHFDISGGVYEVPVWRGTVPDAPGTRKEGQVLHDSLRDCCLLIDLPYLQLLCRLCQTTQAATQAGSPVDHGRLQDTLRNGGRDQKWCLRHGRSRKVPTYATRADSQDAR
jgi:hypothetical protein